MHTRGADLIKCRNCLKGAVGLAKVALGMDAAPDAVIAERRDACRMCDRATRNPSPRYVASMGLSSLSRCLECKCFIAAKTKLAGERCPLGKWPESRTA